METTETRRCLQQASVSLPRTSSAESDMSSALSVETQRCLQQSFFSLPRASSSGSDTSTACSLEAQCGLQQASFLLPRTSSTGSDISAACSTTSIQADTTHGSLQGSDLSPLRRAKTPWRPRPRPSSSFEQRTMSVESDASIANSAASSTSDDVEDNTHTTSFSGFRRAATPWRPRPRRTLSSGSDASAGTGSGSRDPSPERELKCRTHSVLSSASTACTEDSTTYDLDDSQWHGKNRHVEVQYTDEPGRIEIILVERIDYSMVGENWEALSRRRRLKEKFSFKVFRAQLQSNSQRRPETVNQYCNLAESRTSCEILKARKKTARHSVAGARFKDRSHQQR